MIFVFFFNLKTAYEMLISDWSSDVCSSGLPAVRVWSTGSDGQLSTGAGDRGTLAGPLRGLRLHDQDPPPGHQVQAADRRAEGAPGGGRRGRETGRASGREREGKYVSISVVDEALKKKNKEKTQKPTQ